MDKEQELVTSEQVAEMDNVDDVRGDEKETGHEVDGYIEEMEKAGEKTGPVPTDDQGQPLVQHVPQPQDDSPVGGQLPDGAVVLPMTQSEFEEGIHAPLLKAARWLAEWCSYMIKKFGEKVFFRG